MVIQSNPSKYKNNVFVLCRGVFTISLSIQFHTKWEKPNLVTNWFLSFSNSGDQKTMDIEFQKLTDETIND